MTTGIPMLLSPRCDHPGMCYVGMSGSLGGTQSNTHVLADTVIEHKDLVGFRTANFQAVTHAQRSEKCSLVIENPATREILFKVVKSDMVCNTVSDEVSHASFIPSLDLREIPMIGGT